MKIIKAETAGFCFGVNRAVNMVYELLDKGERVCTLGPIIHNPQLVEELTQKGVRIVDSPDEVTEDETLVIRSHGIASSVYDRIASLGIKMADATCPFVAKIHKIVSEKSRDGYVTLIAVSIKRSRGLSVTALANITSCRIPRNSKICSKMIPIFRKNRSFWSLKPPLTQKFGRKCKKN